MSVLVEAAVESLDDALSAVAGGAGRLELCARLDVGGTTPDLALIECVVREARVPVLAMIRPRGGDFVHSSAELARMHADVRDALRAGAAGVVLGALDATSRVDVAATASLVRAAGGAPVTFHRAIDDTPDALEALDALIELGVARVLTSGGAPTALDGAEVLAALVQRAGDRVTIVAGGGVRGGNARLVVERTGVRELHARCEGDAARIRAIREAVSSRV
ncbi:MAG TPA: copper homeostasis protein CutC [Gemmatimonadaceae bacterium]|nr:copper homeostasis protein CutC [Gemmatimonadaceae bacterium]